MPSARADANIAAHDARSVSRVLDLAFGFFVWAAHFLIIYIATAVSCVLGLGGASNAARTGFLTTLALITVAAAVLVIVHGLLRYMTLRAVPEQRFRMSVTVGCDAVAAIAIIGQFLPIFIVPLCA